MLLEERIAGNLKGRYYESPLFNSSPYERFGWLYSGDPFFPLEVREVWKIYNNALKKYNVVMDYGQEVDERRRFMKSPVFVAADTDIKRVVGGIWIDYSYPTGEKTEFGNKKAAVFHINALRSHRHAAYPLMDFFRDIISKHCHYLEIHWDRRTHEDDPSNFLKNNGFVVKGDSEGGSAFLNLYPT